MPDGVARRLLLRHGGVPEARTVARLLHGLGRRRRDVPAEGAGLERSLPSLRRGQPPAGSVRATRTAGSSWSYTISGLSRWQNGGDYIGMTADADGVFHPLWADGRSGTYQLYTSAVRVRKTPRPAAAGREASSSSRSRSSSTRSQYDGAARGLDARPSQEHLEGDAVPAVHGRDQGESRIPTRSSPASGDDALNFLNSSNGKTGRRRDLRLRESSRRARRSWSPTPSPTPSCGKSRPSRR